MTNPIPGGFLLVIEGIDGSGKTTQAQMFADLCAEHQLTHSRSKEPTRGEYGMILRQSALTGRLSVEEELDLFLKDRREHVERVIAPGLARGGVVILDRYYYSTAAYQGSRGADPKMVLAENTKFAPPPDLLILLDLEPEVGIARIRQRGDEPNKFEDVESLSRARAIFNSLNPPYLVRIDATASVADIHDQVKNWFLLKATDKISRENFSPVGVNKILELFGESALPIPAQA